MNENKEQNGREHRRKMRVDYYVPVHIETGDMAIPSMGGVICDLSAQGAMLIVKEKLYNGLLVKVTFEMEKKFDPIVGYVQWQRPGEPGEYKIGIRFDDDLSEQEIRVINLITEKMINETREKQVSDTSETSDT